MQNLLLPDENESFGTWSLEDGKLQFVPVEGAYGHHNGFRWDGAKFISIPPKPRPLPEAGTTANLSPDDLDDDEDAGKRFLGSSARKSFKDAGWHYKNLMGYSSKDAQSSLAINMANGSFNLIVTDFPHPTSGTPQLDVLQFGTKTIELSSNNQPEKVQVLWHQKGRQAISKNEFDMRAKRTGQSARAPVTLLVWLAFFAFATFWRFGTWGHLLLNLLGMKRRVLKNMATSYSFPPATPAQFPQLDTLALDRYSQEFESMGFVRLLDFSLVSNAALPIPSFCRLFAHARHHCLVRSASCSPEAKPQWPSRVRSRAFCRAVGP